MSVSKVNPSRRRGRGHIRQSLTQHDLRVDDFKVTVQGGWHPYASLSEKQRLALRYLFNFKDAHEYAEVTRRAALMCLLCSHTAKRSSDRDPITGICVAQKACAKRRAELDNWTIKDLGLVPRTRKQ